MTVQETSPEYRVAEQTIEVSDENLQFRQVVIQEMTPTGTQIGQAAGFPSAAQVVVMHFLPDGELEDVRPTEKVDLRRGDRRFIVVETDRISFLTVNGERFEWPSRVISGAVVRRLGKVSAEDELLLTRAGEPDRIIALDEIVDLDRKGIEVFVSRKQTWKLNVQGVLLTLHQPTILVRTALQEAGFNPDRGWQIFLIVKGQPKKAVKLTDTIDLCTPGIDKLRLTPDGVHNGETAVQARRQFALLDVDEAYLNSLGCFWETVIDANSPSRVPNEKPRWLLIHNYPVPEGYTSRMVLMALLIPPTYPGAQIDMFYTSPKLALTSGRPIDRTQVSAMVCGTPFNGWSRHRSPQAPWNPAMDNVMTHLALVKSAIAKEVGL